MVTLGDAVAVLEGWYPPVTAESWDRVGLVVGDRRRPVTKVLCTVDVTWPVVEQAIATGADLVVAHHPLLLRGTHQVTADEPKGAMVLRLAEHRIGLWAGHTNADIASGGVGEALAHAIGLQDLSPMEERPSPGLDNLVTFVPPDRLDELVAALTAAGAGRVGSYDSCHFVAPGTGAFRPLEGAHPYVGTVGQLEHVEEVRLEMVLPRARRRTVIAALLAAHPYETPAWHVVETAAEPADTGLGRVGTLPAELALAAFGQQVADALPATSGGVRIGGDPDRPVRRVAVLAGAGDSLLDRARALGVDCYVTSDLRHHPAGEFLEWSHLDPARPALVDISHWAAEWTWLPVLATRLAEHFGPAVGVQVSEIVTDPWTGRFDHRVG
ncbi:dinuclear metal center protein, YbgI/SA1388 family [Raineyella antarctica]|uniref:GTP cyclohydrolase 1 type 2 homolog n=1 Tax=Raineyella antarctica TaxID=1577474 RepID=A0A1G6H2F2_9ACTN|nr:Nif3-like dinuclear metal center hexameric protein [Raineyella antarctica]SDB88381.1 dinuclear metal center protein, YbgI/SA1388 family [Raineyella antarctica]